MKISTISPRSKFHTMHKRHKDFYPRKTQTREKPSNTFLKKKFNKYNTYSASAEKPMNKTLDKPNHLSRYNAKNQSTSESKP